jgi:hypothetical protein
LIGERRRQPMHFSCEHREAHTATSRAVRDPSRSRAARAAHVRAPGSTSRRNPETLRGRRAVTSLRGHDARIRASIRSDCGLPRTAPVRQRADSGAGTPSLLTARMRPDAFASVRVGSSQHVDREAATFDSRARCHHSALVIVLVGARSRGEADHQSKVAGGSARFIDRISATSGRP